MAESSPHLPPAVGKTQFQRSAGHLAVLADEASICNSVDQKYFLSFLGNNSNTCPLWRTQIAEYRPRSLLYMEILVRNLFRG